VIRNAFLDSDQQRRFGNIHVLLTIARERENVMGMRPKKVLLVGEISRSSTQ